MSEFHFTHPGYVPVLDQVFDIALGECSPAEFKVLAAILRKTFGYGKLADRISYSQLMGMTHLSKRAVMLAVKSLVASNWIVKYKWSGLNWYMIKLDGKMVYSVSKQNFRGKLSIPPWYTEYTSKLSKEVYSVYTQETDLETNIETVFASHFSEEETKQTPLKNFYRYEKNGRDAAIKLQKEHGLKPDSELINYWWRKDYAELLNHYTGSNYKQRKPDIIKISPVVKEAAIVYIAAE